MFFPTSASNMQKEVKKEREEMRTEGNQETTGKTDLLARGGGPPHVSKFDMRLLFLKRWVTSFLCFPPVSSFPLPLPFPSRLYSISDCLHWALPIPVIPYFYPVRLSLLSSHHRLGRDASWLHMPSAKSSRKRILSKLATCCPPPLLFNALQRQSVRTCVRVCLSV